MTASPSSEAATAAMATVPEDETGFAGLVRQHQAMVLGLARRALGNAADAEEVAQETFLALYRNRGTIDSESHLIFWLRQATLRRCIDRRRRRWRWTEIGQADELTASPRSEADPWLVARLRRLLRELPMPPRLVLLLRYQEDLNPEEIAPLLDMPLATVKSHLRRSLERLRRNLHA